MTKEALEKRLAELQAALEQITANGNATMGAINECRYWLKQLETEKEAEA
jgi:hypothetical protein